MKKFLEKFNQQDYLDYGNKLNVERELYKHERMKYRILTFLEKNIFGKKIGGFKNYVLIKKEE